MKIIVIDESRDVQASLCAVLASIPGAEVGSCAAHADQVRAAIGAAGADVVVIDAELGDGFEALATLREIRQQFPALPVVALSNAAWVLPSTRSRLLDAGASVVFDKAMEIRAARDWIARLSTRAA